VNKPWSSKYSIEILFSEMDHRLREIITSWRDAIKYQWYSDLRIKIPAGLNDKRVAVVFYNYPDSRQARLLLTTPEESDCITLQSIPDWLETIFLLRHKLTSQQKKPVGTRDDYKCGEKCEAARNYICGTDGKTYQNFCHLKQTACQTKQDLVVVHEGRCNKNGKRW